MLCTYLVKNFKKCTNVNNGQILTDFHGDKAKKKKIEKKNSKMDDSKN